MATIGRQRSSWTKGRVSGLVVGVSLFLAVASALSPVKTDIAMIAFTFDDLIPREMRTSSLAIMSLMTVAVVALWSLIVDRLLRRSACYYDISDT